jgi:hypothetical protein
MKVIKLNEKYIVVKEIEITHEDDAGVTPQYHVIEEFSTIGNLKAFLCDMRICLDDFWKKANENK